MGLLADAPVFRTQLPACGGFGDTVQTRWCGTTRHHCSHCFPLFLRAPGPCWVGSFQQLISTVLAQRCHLVPIHPCHSVGTVAYKGTAGTWHSFHLALWGFISQPFCCHLPASPARSCYARVSRAPRWALWLSTAMACGNTAVAAKHAALWHSDPLILGTHP